ncbi:MAG: glycosyltransferase family 9 protein [Ignavibacteria bacterium]|nr:glycosyltransferase family 9 protein [Ignavibacteria bacterium]
MKILINALSGNGDALMFSPALRLLKEKLPESEIDMLVMFKSVKEMYEDSPFLNNVYFVNFLKQSKLRSLGDVRRLKDNDYDYSINVYPANRLEYNIVNSFLGAKKKIAHHYTHTEFSRAEFLNDILIDEIKDRHNVLQNLDLIKPIVNVSDDEAGQMEIFISDDDKAKAAEWIKENNLEGKFIIGFHPGSSVLKNHIHKRWDKNKYAELGNKLMKENDAKILLFGNEFDLNNEIKAVMDNEALIASTHNYMDSIARMTHCKLFVSNDTAFMHSAAALQIPTVGIFAYTNHKELYPWKTKHAIVRKDLDCSPCFYNSPRPATCIFKGEEEFKCMKMIEEEEVYEAVKQLIVNRQS